MSTNLLQSLSTIPNVGGTGVPVQQYASTMQKVLTAQMTAVPNSELSTLQTTSSALSSLQTALQQLQTASQSLASPTTWETVDATSSNTNAFTVSGGAGALPSSFSVSIAGLAQNQIDVAQVTQTSTTGTSTLTGGIFSIFAATTSGSATGTALATITVTAGESLSTLVSDVNNSTASTHVQAFLLGNSVAFESTQTGAANGFVLQDQNGGNVISTQLGMKQQQAAQDASITIAGTTVTSATNSFSNIVPGVTLTALQANSTGTLTVTQSTSGTVSTVQNWMKAYNNVIDMLSQATAYSPPSATASGTTGPLVGNAIASGLQSALPNSVNQIISGVQHSLSSLASVGIVEDPNTGHLVFQSSSGFKINGKSFGGTLQSGQTVFQNAIDTNLSGVQQLFGVVPDITLSSAVPTTGVLGNLNNTLNQYLGYGSTKGAIPTEQTSIQTQETSIQNYLAQVNQMITSQVSNFTAQLNQLNASLSQAQSQMQMIGAMFGGSSSSSASTANTINGASTSGG